MELKTITKFILGALITIALGAIGSGVWEKLLSPGLTYTANAFTSFISSVSTTYSDSIYSRASNISYHDKTAPLVSFILFFVFLGLFIFSLNSKKDHTFVGIVHRSFILQFSGWWGIIYSGAMLVVIVFLLATETSVSYIQKYSSKQMEILRPYVGEHEYHILKSNFLQIENKENFDSFLQKLREHGKEELVEIEKFKNV